MFFSQGIRSTVFLTVFHKVVDSEFFKLKFANVI